MGSALGPLFANFYMCSIENDILPTLQKPPLIYTRYVDDILLMIDNIKSLQEIKQKFENASVLKFTYETERQKSLPFLDIRVTRTEQHLTTDVFIKPTNTGECINYNSISPDRYKLGVTRTFLHRAFNTCSTYQSLHLEIQRIKQLLTNNNFPMEVIDGEVRKFMDPKYSNMDENPTEKQQIPLYYQNQMNSQYLQEEKSLRKIISNHVAPREDTAEVKLQIYYKSRTLRQLFVKNNPHKVPVDKRSHCVYKYSCPKEKCQPFTNYIGYTECILTDRLRNHAQNGSIKVHNIDYHKSKVTTQDILNNTQVLCYFNTKEELTIAEALHIKQENPRLNQQREGETRVLSIF